MRVDWAAGSDGTGSSRTPYRTVNEAVSALRTNGGARDVVIAPGIYYFPETLELDERLSGVTIRAEKEGTVVFSGAEPVVGWRSVENAPFWEAEVAGVREGKRFFRSLIVNGRLATRAQYPAGTNRLYNTGVWNVRWMSSVGNGWERPPTRDELVVMPYRAGDLPTDFDCASAEVRVFHMWNESLVRVASNDTAQAKLFFREPMECPAGAHRRNGYVIHNTREGLTEPGQWRLDCTVGKLVYWPLPNEDMTKIRVFAPKTETLLSIVGKPGQPVTNVTIRGIAFEGTRPPMRRASFGGVGLPGALAVRDAAGCVFTNLRFVNTGAIGATFWKCRDCRVTDSVFEDTGSCAMTASTMTNFVFRANKIHRTGRVFQSACGVSVNGLDVHFAANEISDTPYCGVCFGGQRVVFENNRVSRVMTLLHDGAAFYGGGNGNCVMRGNYVTDIAPNGKGNGCSAFYFDEGAYDGLVESNRTEGVALPVHNHMARRIMVRGNDFRMNGDCRITFARCRDSVFVDNVCRYAGTLTLPDATVFREWKGNTFIANGVPTNAAPVVLHQKKQWDKFKALPIAQTPVFDGTLDASLWPGVWQNVWRGEDFTDMGGAPRLVRAAYDATNVYFAVRAALFRHETMPTGHDWEKDGGVEFAFEKFRLRGFPDGTSEGATAFYGGLRRTDKSGYGKDFIYVFRVPWSSFGLAAVPTTNLEIPFNVSIRDGLYNETRWWESPSSDTRLTGRMIFQTANKDKQK